MIYLIHFDKPYHHASHYLGFVDGAGRLEARMELHRSGQGAKLLRALKLAGIGWRVVRTWPDGTRDQERALKRRKSTPHHCPVCCKAKGRKPWGKDVIKVNRKHPLEAIG